ncbi:thiamine-phosphate kinase [Ornithinibacillus salinisoli]|uniref:Thiamine-monophosphate kinase n=1 Tax=Ornithinibacillus salinisoli TaxID=1848459 RepID=A0ABW4W5G9_9BACI
MDEFSFINSIKQHTYQQSSVVKGIGDDAAVFRQSSQDIVIAKDMFVEGVHFSRQTMEAYHIGYRALAANLSDLAAMGATPAFYLVAIAIPDNWSSLELDQIYQGMKVLGKKYKMDLIGGDTVSSSELTVSVTVIGYVGSGGARYRNSAQDGDIVFVTGTLGDSQAGFHILNNPGNYKNEAYFIKRHRMPTARIEFVKALKDCTRLSLNDISDGIASEATEIAEDSDVHIHLYEEQIPVSKLFTQFPPNLQHKWKYFGGEDFELVGTIPKNEWSIVQQAAISTNIRLSQIGYVTAASNVKDRVFLHRRNGTIERLDKKGFNHLRR